MSRLREAPGPVDGSILPKDFPLYLPDFEPRFNGALKKPPLAGLLYKSSRWNEGFISRVKKSDEISKREEICSHGMNNHLLQVTQNALALSDAISNRSKTLTDENLAFAALTHDLGYSDPSINWINKHAIGHQDASVRILDELRTREVELFPIEDEELYDSLVTLNRNFDVFSRAINTTSDDQTIIVEAAKQAQDSPTDENLFPVVIGLADKLDLFRAQRLEGINPPQNYAQNPYFFLSQAVNSYEISVAQDAITYSVDLKEHTPGSKWSLSEWREKVDEAGYGKVFEAAEIFARSQGKRFEVAEMQEAA